MKPSTSHNADQGAKLARAEQSRPHRPGTAGGLAVVLGVVLPKAGREGSVPSPN